MESDVESAPRLDYSPAGRRTRRRWSLAAGIALLVLALCLGGRHVYPRVSRHLALRACVWECVNWKPPSGTPVYDDDPATVAALTGRPDYRQSLEAACLRVPPMERLDRLLTLGLAADAMPPVFTQTLALGNQHRIVSLSVVMKVIAGEEYEMMVFKGVIVNPRRWYEAPVFSKDAVEPVDPTLPPQLQHPTAITLLIPKRGGHLRIEAGAPDPVDPASALYPYSFGGRRGHVRVRLRPDESVELSPETGPLFEALDKPERGVKTP
jgi:hypothetical protein